MKKIKLFGIALIACCVATSGIKAWSDYKFSKENPVIMENIEALVAGECTAGGSHCAESTNSVCWYQLINANGNLYYQCLPKQAHVGSDR